MIKKLDILVLKAFAGPFIATFFLTLFVLILQFFWLWIDDFVGKGIDAITILRLTTYLSATLVPLALPLAVLLSSIMTFGNLGESFELVAIKSAGIGLLRFMRPLLVVSMLLAGLAFLFNNYVIPVANLKMRTLHTDLVNAKPAFDLKEGEFYKTIPGYAIKVAKKVNDSLLANVIIYESNASLQDNIIVADSGVMRVTPDKRYLEFILRNGWRYQERGDRSNRNLEFIRLGFKEYKKVLDLSALSLNFSSDSLFKNRYEMLSVRQLNTMVDSLEKQIRQIEKQSALQLRTYLRITQYIDTGWLQVKVPPVKVAHFWQLLPDSVRKNVTEESITYATNMKSTLFGPALDYESKRKELRLYLIEWHNKFTLSLAVLVLFMIGAPLGSIVRKGGIGTPVVFAVIFFVIFFLLNNFGRKFVKEDVLQPIAGMWMATLLLLPVGLFLTYKAVRDSQLFSKEFYFRAYRFLSRLAGSPRRKAGAEPEPAEKEDPTDKI